MWKLCTSIIPCTAAHTFNCRKNKHRFDWRATLTIDFFQTKVCDWRTDLPLQWSDAWRCHRRDGPRAGGESQHRSAGRGPSLKHTHTHTHTQCIQYAIPLFIYSRLYSWITNIEYGIWLIPLTWLAESRLICGPLLVLYCGQLQLS